MDAGLSTALTFLAYTCVILAVVLGVFLAFLIKETIDCLKSYRNLSETVQKEIYPTLEEIKKALQSINGLASGVDKQFSAIKSSFGSAYDIAFNAASKFRGAAVSLFSGILAGLKIFLKK